MGDGLDVEPPRRSGRGPSAFIILSYYDEEDRPGCPAGDAEKDIASRKTQEEDRRAAQAIREEPSPAQPG